MFVILVYDTASERNPVALRTCRRYLHHVQYSVFEGQLTEAQLHRLTAELQTHLDTDYDRVRLYTVPDPAWVDTLHLGTDESTDPTVI